MTENLHIQACSLADILPLRALYLQELHAQSRYHACHERGWADEYGVFEGDQMIGYGSIKGLEELKDRDAIFEFFLLPTYRDVSKKVFLQLIDTSKATHAEAQSNDGLMCRMLYEFGKPVKTEVVLFKEGRHTKMRKDNVLFRRRKTEDEVLGDKDEPSGDYVLEKDGSIIADGGFLLHYNPPFADVFMEVVPEFRNRGYGRYLVQEIKKECYLAGKVPAARCNLSNQTSRACLEAAGFEVAGYMLSTKLRKR
ncbi:MAG: GNAT family N-acetyltransferase [Bacteroidota bacterium]